MRDFPRLGHGIGLRPPHYPRVLDGTARPDWIEVISENFMIRGGRPLHVLEHARALAPIVLHGVSMTAARKVYQRKNTGMERRVTQQ